MTTFILSAFMDGALTLAFAFFALYTTLLSFKVQKWAAILLSALLSAIFAFFVYRLSAAKKRSSLNDEKNDISACMRTLNACTADEIFSIFTTAFSNMRIRADVFARKIAVGDGFTLIPAFLPSPVSANEVASIIRSADVRHPDKAIILSAVFTHDAITFAEETGVKLFSADKVYDFLKEASALPPVKRQEKKPFYKGLNKLLYRRNGVRFIIFGLSLVIMAFMVFYPVYYYVAGGALVVFGTAALLFGKRPTPNERESIAKVLGADKKE